MKKKNVLALLFASCLTISLAACGNNDNTKTTFETTTIETTTETINETTTETIVPTTTMVQEGTVSFRDCKNKLTVGEELELSVKVSPKGLDVEYTIESTDPSVIEVKDGKVIAKELGEATITLNSLDGKYSDEIHFDVIEKASWTIMLYLCGSDLVYSMMNDICDMLSVKEKPEDVNIIIETGGSESWEPFEMVLPNGEINTYSISNSNIERYHIENQKLVLDETLPDASMGSVNAYQDFITWGLTEYPAEKTGVVISSHGGAMRGTAMDLKHNDDRLTNQKMKNAMTHAFENSNRTEPLEFIGYDACLMQMQDVAEFNSEFYKYMIASQDEITGWENYDEWFDNVYRNESTEEIVKEIIDTYQEVDGYFNISTMSVLDLSNMEAYKNAFEDIAAVLLEKINKDNIHDFTKLIESVESYDGYWDGDRVKNIYGNFDALDFFNKLSSSELFNPGDELIANAIQAFDDLVLYNYSPANYFEANGLCMFYEISTDCDRGLYYTKNHTNFSNWLKLIQTWTY